MENRAKRFLACWTLVFLALALLVSAFDITVDPYRAFDMPLMKGFNARKGAASDLEWPYKAYEVQRIAPRTVLLGSSRVALGMDTQSAAWPKEYRPVYNLGLPAAGPYVWFRYLQHLMAVRVPETVIVGLDFEYFLDVIESRHSAFGKFESRLSVKSDGTLNMSADRQHVLDLLQFSLSYDALSDSVSTVIGNVQGVTKDTILGNESDAEELRVRADTGTFPWMQWINVIDVRRLVGGRNQFAMVDIQDLLYLCKSHGTHVILYIHPMPADMLEMIDMMGYWPMFEGWKRELLSMVSAYDRQGGRATLWDFSDYDTYSTDTPRQDGRVLPWFWESWHYRKALGDLVVGRIVGQSELPFGIFLLPDRLEGHLTQIRERQREYRASHPADVARLKAVHDAALRVLSSPAMAARYALSVPSEQ